MISKIISGGQTGADQAALDVAIELGILHGGWVPKGRRTERGPLPAKYQLKEMSTDSYPKRTEQNVMHSDGTLIISHGELTGGSEYTKQLAEKHDKPWVHVDAKKVSVEAAVQLIRAWINGSQIKVLNVAGPRASKDPQIYATTKKILKAVLTVAQSLK
jgi:Circularly permutated YpsA SLOG family